jgi:LPXTG-motif cell wall-anchored protein
MKHFRNVAFAALAGCIGFALLPSLKADEWNKKTILTVNEPLEVPSCCTPDHTVILQPGEYVIVLVDSLSDRHIVRIFDKDQKHVMTTILAIPNYRLKVTGKTEFGFWEVPAGQPAALRAWFYPGDNFGQEFAYPKQKAAEIAAFVKVPVPAIIAETTVEEDLKTTPLVVVQETGTTEPVPQVAVAEVAAPAAPPTPEAPVETPAPVQTLPHTASNMPLVGLAGLLSLAMFAALGFSSRRRSSSKA